MRTPAEPRRAAAELHRDRMSGLGDLDGECDTLAIVLPGFRLYHYTHSSMSWVVRMGLHVKGVSYEGDVVDIRRESDARDKRDYLSVNPFAQVPVLEWTHDGKLHRVSQSTAILELLEELVPEPALLPRDSAGRARCRELAAMIQSGIQPLQNNYVLGRVAAFGGDERAWARHFIERGLGALERTVASNAREFLTGDALRLPDLYLGAQLFNARRIDLALDPYPTLLRIEHNLRGLESYRATHPDAL